MERAKQLKSFNGYEIEKSWLVNDHGKVIEGSTLYHAYNPETDGLVAGAETLAERKNKLKTGESK